MFELLRWFRLEEAPQIVALAIILIYAGNLMTQPDHPTIRRARWMSAAAFLFYVVAGVCSFGASDASELLSIILSGLLAAGLLFGFGLLTLMPLASVCRALFRLRWRTPSRPTYEVIPPVDPPEIISLETAAEARELEHRMSDINNARNLVALFYDEDADLLADAMPRALFTAEMKTRFPEGITPDQAWAAARAFIAELKPMLDAAREKKRVADDAKKKAEEDIAAQVPDDGRTGLERIADWYQREKDALMRLPEVDRDKFLMELEETNDRLIKDSLAKATP